jgi:serine/threonine protein kinase
MIKFKFFFFFFYFYIFFIWKQEISIKITEIILGVCVLHTNRVAHFDLKPGNILIDDKGHLRLCIYKYIFYYIIKFFIFTYLFYLIIYLFGYLIIWLYKVIMETPVILLDLWNIHILKI